MQTASPRPPVRAPDRFIEQIEAKAGSRCLCMRPLVEDRSHLIRPAGLLITDPRLTRGYTSNGARPQLIQPSLSAVPAVVLGLAS